MELTDIVLLGLLSCVISSTVCIICALIVRSIRDRDVNTLYGRVESIEMHIRGGIGNQKRAEKAERMQMAMVDAAHIMKDEKITDKQQALLALALKYPEIALDMIKKGI